MSGPKRGHDVCNSLISRGPKRALNLLGTCEISEIHQVLQSLPQSEDLGMSPPELPTRSELQKSRSRSGFAGIHEKAKFSAGPKRQFEKIALMRVPAKPERGFNFGSTLQVLNSRMARRKFCILRMPAKHERGHDFYNSLISRCPKWALNLQGVCKLPKIHQVLQSL